MATKKTKRRKQRSRAANRRPTSSLENEDRRSIAVTVGWMLSLLATAAAELVAVAVQGLSLLINEADTIRLLADWLLFTATVCGIATLLLTPVTLKVREVRPPPSIVTIAIVVGVSPLLVVVCRAFVAA